MYEYRHVEDALAKMFEVAEDQRPAFRARLRYLRNLGVPRIEKPGSGRRISYSRKNAIELALVLEAQALGIPPRQTVKQIKDIVDDGFFDVADQYMIASLRPFAREGHTHFVSVRIGAPDIDFANSRRFGIINVSLSVEAIDAALRGIPWEEYRTSLSQRSSAPEEADRF